MEPQYKTSRPLKIVYIADNFDADNNGTTISVRRFVDALRSFGHSVIVVSNGRPEKDKVVMGSYTKGFVAWYVKRECMVFARPDEKLIREALEGADIAHFQIPFYLECKGLSIARQMDIPCTAGFHCQPENITGNIVMGWCTPLADLIFKIFNCIFYKKIDHIHCPTHFIASELERQHYKAKCHVISNGVDLKKYHPIPVERPESLKSGTVHLVGTDYNKSFSEVSTLLDDALAYEAMSKAVNPYGDGQACRRIVDILADEETDRYDIG